MKIKNYKELLAYQKSYEVALPVYKLRSVLPSSEVYVSSSQTRRGAISVPSNISEGYTRGSKKEYIQFSKVSLGSNTELETQLSLSRDLGFIENNKFKQVYELNEEVGRLLSSYISRLENSG